MESFENETTSDLFPALADNNLVRICSLAFAITSIILGPPLFYSIIWFERFGSDKKRTLINKLVATNCWIGISFSIFVQAPEVVRFIYGPLPHIICSVQNVLKFYFVCSYLLCSDAIIVSNYAYIFWLKNPAAFNDDFWCLFISLWIRCISMITMGTLHFLVEFKTFGCLICTGKIEIQGNLPTALTTGIVSVIIASALIHFFLRLRILIHEKVRLRILSFCLAITI